VKVPLTRPLIGDEEIQAVAATLRSGWVTQGPQVAGFERDLATYTDARYACATSSCTTALHLSLLAVGVGLGDEVITVSHSFIATANAIRYCGATPVFVDIMPDTFNINPALLEQVITPQSKAILCVHQMGMPCDLQAILDVAHRHNLPVIEDAACAIGSEIRWKGKWEKIGKPHGDIACFSFHPRKILTTGDGGMLTTSNAEFNKKFRLFRQHCMSVPDAVRHGANEVIFERYPALGYNYRLSDIQGALGREQMKRLPQIIQRRRFLAQRYAELLAEVPTVKAPEEPSWARSNWQSYCVRLVDGSNQKNIMQAMLDEGVATRRGIMCAHREDAYRQEDWSCGTSRYECNCPAGTCSRLRESEISQDSCLILPLFYQMSEAEQDEVVDSLVRACAKYY
jgi:perosamine synthetase